VKQSFSISYFFLLVAHMSDRLFLPSSYFSRHGVSFFSDGFLLASPLYVFAFLRLPLHPIELFFADRLTKI